MASVSLVLEIHAARAGGRSAPVGRHAITNVGTRELLEEAGARIRVGYGPDSPKDIQVRGDGARWIRKVLDRAFPGNRLRRWEGKGC